MLGLTDAEITIGIIVWCVAGVVYMIYRLARPWKPHGQYAEVLSADRPESERMWNAKEETMVVEAPWTPVSVEIDGLQYSGAYAVAQNMITVATSEESVTAPVARTPTHMLAELLLRTLVQNEDQPQDEEQLQERTVGESLDIT